MIDGIISLSSLRTHGMTCDENEDRYPNFYCLRI